MSKGTLSRWAPMGAALLIACGEATGPASVESVAVSPAAVTLAVGQSTSLAGTPVDGQGNAVTGSTVTWSSATASVATVSDAGLVTGVAEGTTSITAAAEGVTGTASVTVVPAAVATVEIAPAQPASLLPGETAQLTATTLDGDGNVLTGRAVTWVSNDGSVATVDAAGLVAAVAPGIAIVFATAEGVSGQVTIDVDNPNAARILSILPAELIEGQPATLTGENFSAVSAQNVVTVDGVRATVTGGTETTLDFVVPALDCRPRHLADVAITVFGDTDEAAHPVAPGAFFGLAAGAFTVLSDPTSYCLQFDATAADEEYLIGVQSTVEDPASLTFVQLTGDTDAATPAAIAGARAPLAAPASSAFDDAAALRMLRMRSREAEVMHGEIEMARRIGPGAGPLLSSPALIPGNVTVGTAVTLRYPELDGNTCSDFVSVPGTVRYVGTNAIWVSDDANPADGYGDANYQSLSDEFDGVVHQTLTDFFGDPTDVDGNDRIVVMVTKEVNDDGIGGIVPSANLFSPGTCAASNGPGEYFFMFAPDPTGIYQVGAINVASALAASLPIIGHEFVHNIHVSRRFAGPGLWDSWLHEGQATFGEEILGHAINGRSPGQNYDWDVVDNTSGADDRAWYRDSFVNLFLYFGWGAENSLTLGPGTRRANAPEGCTWIDTPAGTNAGVCANRGSLVYGVTWSFMRWVTDHYAGLFTGGEAEMHTTWIDGADGGFESLESLTGETIENLLAGWAASLYLDDRVVGADPLITIPSWDLLDIQSSVVPEARLEPRTEAFGDFSESVQVRGASAAYFLVSGANRPSTAVKVRSPSGGFLSPSVQVWVARVR